MQTVACLRGDAAAVEDVLCALAQTGGVADAVDALAARIRTALDSLASSPNSMLQA